MSLAVAAQPLLDRPTLRVLVELWTESSCPLTLPAALGGGPWLLSTEDLVVAAITRAPRLPYSAEVLADTPAGYWRLGDRSGTQAWDRSGNARHGTYVGSPTLGAAGALASCLDTAVTLNGSSQSVSVAHNAAFNFAASDEFAVECWAKRTTTGAYAVLVGKGTSAYPYALYGDTSGGLVAERSDGTHLPQVTYATSIAGAWHHLVFARRAGQLELWVDAVLVGAAADTTSGTVTNTSAVEIGALASGSYWPGSLDEVAIYGHALAWDRIETHYRVGKTASTSRFEGRLLEVPQLGVSSLDAFGGLRQLDQLSIRLANADRACDALLARELRGLRAVVHLYDVVTAELQEAVFSGVVGALAQDAATLDLLLVSRDAVGDATPVPSSRVTLAMAPDAPVQMPASGGLGDVIPLGLGIGRRVPARLAKGRIEDSTLSTLAVTTVTPASDTLTIPDHDLATGDGPYRVASTTSLPGGLEASTDYWIVYVTEDTVRLATTPARAAAELTVDLTSAGSGTITLTTGRGAQYLDEYDYILGLGALGVEAVYVGGELQPPDAYELLYRTYRQGGRYCTAVRFRDDLGDAPVTADVQCVGLDVDHTTVAEWRWLGDFRDHVGGYVVEGSGVTSEDIVTGPTGVGAGGAVEIVVPTPPDDTPAAARYLVTTASLPPLSSWTVRVWWRPLAASVAGNTDTPIVGFGALPGTANVALDYLHQDGELYCWGLHDTFSVALSGLPRWVHICLVHTPTTQQLYVDGVVAETVTGGTAQMLPAGPVWFGPDLPDYDDPAQRIGPVRIDARAWSAEEVARDYYRGRRNPIEFLRDVCLDAGERLDDTTAATARSAIDAVEAGALRCDAWLTEATTMRAVLDAAASFRDLRYTRLPDGRMTVTVATPATTIAAQFGVGAPWANIVDAGVRRRGSILEAPRELAIRYRPARDTSGAVTGWQHEILAAPFAAGRASHVLELPFVYDHTTADVIRDFRVKRLRSRDWQRELTVGHEGRALAPGHIVRVTDSDGSARDYEVLASARIGPRASLTCVGYAEADFTYAPEPIPTDPVPPPRQSDETLASLRLVVTGRSGGVSVIRLLNERDPVDFAARDDVAALTGQWPTIVGGATAALAVAADDGDTSYVETTHPSGRFAVTVDVSGTAPYQIAWIETRAVARLSSGIGGVLCGFWQDPLPTGLTGPAETTGTSYELTGSYATYTQRWYVDPRDGAAWSRARLAGLSPLARTVLLVGTARLTALGLRVGLHDATPAWIGWVRWYVAGPSVSQPATPDETTTAPLATTRDLAITDAVSTSGTYWYWAVPFDRWGRRIGRVGPISVVL